MGIAHSQQVFVSLMELGIQNPDVVVINFEPLNLVMVIKILHMNHSLVIKFLHMLLSVVIKFLHMTFW